MTWRPRYRVPDPPQYPGMPVERAEEIFLSMKAAEAEDFECFGIFSERWFREQAVWEWNHDLFEQASKVIEVLYWHPQDFRGPEPFIPEGENPATYTEALWWAVDLLLRRWQGVKALIPRRFRGIIFAPAYWTSTKEILWQYLSLIRDIIGPLLAHLGGRFASLAFEERLEHPAFRSAEEDRGPPGILENIMGSVVRRGPPTPARSALAAWAGAAA